MNYASYFDYSVGKAFDCIYAHDYENAAAYLRQAISLRNLPRPKRVPTQYQETVVRRFTFYPGAALKHIFMYSRNADKEELRTALKYLLTEIRKEKEHANASVSQC